MSELKTEVDAGAPVSLFHVLFCRVVSCFVVSCRVVNAFYCRCYRRCRHQLVYGMQYALYTLSYPLLVGYIYSTTTTTTTTQFFDTLYLFFEINILPSFSH